MTADSPQELQPGPVGPSMLDLLRLSPRRIAPPGGADLLRQVALLGNLSEGDEVLCVPCGPGVGLQYFVEEWGVQGSGVDPDPALVSRAQEWARTSDLGSRFTVQEGSPADLPYRDGIFDLTVGELGLTADADPGRAVSELVRVTRPGGMVVLIQLVWKAPLDPERRRVLSSHLGVTPLMLVEWKRLLKENGLEEIRSEDWSDEETAFRPRVRKPFPDFAELFSVSEKMGILGRARGRWGWRGVATALFRELEVHRLLTRERILGLDLVKARKPMAAEVGAETPEPAAAVEEEAAAPGPADPSDPAPPEREADVEDLPLFRRDNS